MEHRGDCRGADIGECGVRRNRSGRAAAGGGNDYVYEQRIARNRHRTAISSAESAVTILSDKKNSRRFDDCNQRAFQQLHGSKNETESNFYGWLETETL